jgi:hypothetical protein
MPKLTMYEICFNEAANRSYHIDSNNIGLAATKRIQRQLFAKFLVQGRTIGKVNGKLIVYGKAPYQLGRTGNFF